MDMPVGSIGPTRQRYVQRLRAALVPPPYTRRWPVMTAVEPPDRRPSRAAGRRLDAVEPVPRGAGGGVRAVGLGPWRPELRR